jgi:hypothetical protein
MQLPTKFIFYLKITTPRLTISDDALLEGLGVLDEAISDLNQDEKGNPKPRFIR